MGSYLLPRFSGGTVSGYLSPDRGRPSEARTNPFLLFYRCLHAVDARSASLALKQEFVKKADLSMVSRLRERQEASLIEWEKGHDGGAVCRGTFELMGRMVVGMGISSSFENGLLLHWVHGVPYVNGETLKGAARSYARESLPARDEENYQQEAKAFQEVFGTLDKEETDPTNMRRGGVIFFDAFPLPAENLFDVDVVTSHYLDYYEKGATPGDWLMPKPVPFLTVNTGVQFEIAVAARDEKLARKAWEWLKKALIRRGVGAKKHVGYGHFMVIRDSHKVSDTSALSDVSTGEGKDSRQESSRSPDPTPAAPDASAVEAAVLEAFKTALYLIKGPQLPGRVSELVKKIERMDGPGARSQAARLLYERLSKDMRKRKDVEWAIKLNAFLGEGSS